MSILLCATMLPLKRGESMPVEFYIYIALMVWIIMEVRGGRKEAKKAAETAEQTKKGIADLRKDIEKEIQDLRSALPIPEPPPYSPHFDAMERQKERTRQFLLERAQRQPPDELPGK